MITMILIAAAVAWLLWPKGGAAPAVPAAADLWKVPPMAAPAPPASPSVPDARAAIDSLLVVRDRLAAAGPIDEESGRAVDRLWLEVLHGSAKK